MPAAASTSTNGRSNRSGTNKLLVVLKLSPSLLKKFASPTDTKDKKKRNSTTASSSKASDTNTDSPSKEKEPPSSPASSTAEPAVPASSVDNASDAASTPAPGTSTADNRRKSLPGAKTGVKRALNPASDSASKPRGKPGPKKRPRLEDGATENVRLSTSHRLGPKANTGAINAGLRALDRSGTPCRKWERKPLQLKSFTGVQWALPSWRAPRPQKHEANGDAKEAVLETGDSDSRANQSASAVPSEKSNSGDGDLTPAPPTVVEASSPAIAMAA
ncbi:INO80 complex, subunit Ies4 [Aspergillus egyptiacus]|nr:INO80 complex, subunit Ies4 [Aspergillus egyptiacus]